MSRFETESCRRWEGCLRLGKSPLTISSELVGWKFAMKIRLALLPLALCAALPAEAATLVLDYSVANNPNGTYRYNFSLRLANQNNTWTPGQQWDWIIFGDRSGFGQPSGFCETGICSQNFFNFTSSDPLARLTDSGGGSQGPTIFYGDSVVLPGWQPANVGDTLNWSGDSQILIGSGQMFWSTLVTGGGAERYQFQAANLTGAGAVPEPATWAMLILGFFGVGAAIRSARRQQNVTVSYA